VEVVTMDNENDARCGDHHCDCGGCFEEEAPPDPRAEFLSLVQTILSLNEGAGAVYERLQATAAPFDRELASKLRACQQADEALIAYCRLKAEAAGRA
jgi:hypothetical protein